MHAVYNVGGCGRELSAKPPSRKRGSSGAASTISMAGGDSPGRRATVYSTLWIFMLSFATVVRFGWWLIRMLGFHLGVFPTYYKLTDVWDLIFYPIGIVCTDRMFPAVRGKSKQDDDRK